MKVSRILLGSFLVLMLAACGNDSPIDPTDPTTTTDPTDPTVTTDPTDPTIPDPTVTTDPTDPTVDMSGTWAGTMTSTSFGTEETTLTLTQSGSSISGTVSIDAVDENGNPVELTEDVSGTLTGSIATISATYPITYTENGTPVAEGEVEYQLAGTVAGTTYSGTLNLAFDNGEQDSGSFTFTQGSSTTDPSDPTDPTTTTDPSDPTTTTDPSTPSGTISGTVTAPTGVDVSDTIIAACLSSSTTTCDGAAEATVDSTGAYTLTGLESAPYTVAGAIDANGSGELDSGDYLGGVTNVTPPDTDVDFALEPFQGTQGSAINRVIESLNEAKSLKSRPLN